MSDNYVDYDVEREDFRTRSILERCLKVNREHPERVCQREKGHMFQHSCANKNWSATHWWQNVEDGR